MAVAGLGLPRTAPAAMLDTHEVVLDGSGKIIPWTSDPAEGYDRVMGLSWSLLLGHMPNDPTNGLPPVYTYSEYSTNTLGGMPWPNNPAGKNAMLSDSALMYFAYSGNTNVVQLVRGLLDYQITNGSTPANYNWPRVPWSTAAAGSTNYGNDTLREGAGVVEPDKLGELGFHGYLRFYELTGETNFLDAALACADALAAHVRTGNATNSPWPFRVIAQSGVTASNEEYCADVVAPVRLFDELIRLGLGDTNAYQAARQTAWNWLMTYPMTNGVWGNYFEDVPPQPGSLTNTNQYDPGQTARYLMEHPELDPNWFAHVTNILTLIETNFGGTGEAVQTGGSPAEPGIQYGAQTISEQTRYNYKMGSHTGRYAANQALLYSLTGDLTAKEKAYRSLNWCTYMCRTNGVVIEGPFENAHDPTCWFTDGHGDYIRHFMVAMGAVPEWAPPGQNHIVHSTSVVRSVVYAPDTNYIAYTTFDSSSTETLRVAFLPAAVFADDAELLERTDLSQPGWVYDPSNGVLRIRHDAATNVQIIADPKTEIQSIADDVSGVTLTWQAAANLHFQVQWADTFASGWNTIPTVVASTNGVFTLTDDGTQSAPLGAGRVYRLKLAP